MAQCRETQTGRRGAHSSQNLTRSAGTFRIACHPYSDLIVTPPVTRHQAREKTGLAFKSTTRRLVQQADFLSSIYCVALVLQVVVGGALLGSEVPGLGGTVLQRGMPIRAVLKSYPSTRS
uniref:Uncharacterized protein n=1 Tax=Paramormyrops kingsleyae TaxID=1676925 RepID=A0A3B3TI24_9TELE